jgi:hypothetical protein
MTALAQERAQSVREFLIHEGVDQAQLKTQNAELVPQPGDPSGVKAPGRHHTGMGDGHVELVVLTR